ncbi:MAG: MFS transporter [Clostridium sp.]
MKIFSFLEPAPISKKMVPDSKIKTTYTKRRFSVFISIYVAYAAYYIVRDNFTISSPYLMQHYHFDKATIGLILSCLAISYGISKFIMGSLADKCNPRYYIATGLICSAILNFFFGTTSNKYIMILLIVLMGIFQGMGAPAAHKTLAVWFSNKERGTYVSAWNTSHNVGGGLVPLIVTLALAIFGSTYWKSIFFLPSVLSIILAIIVILFGADTPESVGLPPIEEFKKKDYSNEQGNITVVDAHNQIPLFEIIKECILKRPAIWILAISNAAVYIIRYGIENWIPIYLHAVKGFSLAQSRNCFSIYEFAAIPGTILIGIISDKIFKGKRSGLAAALIFLLSLTFIAYWVTKSSTLIYFEVGIMGILVYGPQMLITVLTMDLVPKFAVGGTDGFVGLFGYIFGEVIASYVIGALVDSLGWKASFFTIIIASIVSIICFIILINIEKHIHKGLNKIYSHFNLTEN